MCDNAVVVTEMLHSHNKNSPMNSEEREVFYVAGMSVLTAFKQLSIQHRGSGLWVIRPKHHMMHHHCVKIFQTGIVPNWAFADETMNGLIVKMETLSRIIIRKWTLHLAFTIDDE